MATVDRSKYLGDDDVKRLRTEAELWAMKDKASGRRQGVVAWAVVDVALSTGLRVSEMQALTVGDVDLKLGALTVTRRKRRHTPPPETLMISADLAEHLREFIAWKAAVGEPVTPKAALFVGKRGPLSVRGMQLVWHSARARADLPARLSIHAARHTCGTHTYRATKDLVLTQRQLGHTSPTVTANMYVTVTPEEMQDAANKLYT